MARLKKSKEPTDYLNGNQVPSRPKESMNHSPICQGPPTLKAPDLVLCHEDVFPRGRRGGLIRQEPAYQPTAF